MKIFNPPVSRSFATKSLLLICVLSTVAISTHYIGASIAEHNQVATVFTVPKKKVDQFKDLSLQAQAVYVYDVAAKKVLFEKNADYVLPLASITKVMTALVAHEYLNEQPIAITENAFGEYGENKLIQRENWNFKSLIGYILTVSSNDGARAVANAFGAIQQVNQGNTLPTNNIVSAMNTKANQLGLNTLSFNNETGLDIEIENKAGGYGSAKEVSELLLHTMRTYPELLEDTKYANKVFSSSLQSYNAENTDIIINDLPNPIASKTGYTKLSGGNLVVAFDKGLGEPVIIVVLGSTFDGRFEDVTRLAQATMETYNNAK